MSWLTKIALKKRWLTFLIVALVTGASIWGMITIKMELIPNIEFPVTTVITVYPQAKPDDVMNEVTIPIEDVIAEIKGLNQLISSSAEGSSFVIAIFDYGSDMDEINGTIRQGLNELDLPAGVRDVPSQMPQMTENPRLYAIDMNIMPLVTLSLIGDLSPDELQEIALTSIVPKLEGIEGVYHVGVEGGYKEQVIIDLDPATINKLGISMSQVAGVLSAGEYDSLSEVENTFVGVGNTVLKDIAGVKLGLPSGTALNRTNGKTSVSISVMKIPEANTVTVANAVIAEVDNIREALGDDIEIVTVLDQSTYIEKSIGDLTRNAIIGCALAIIIVFLFLVAFRASLVTAVSIPLSILIALLVMRLTGMTVNLLTLSAIAIAVGRVIDNSIVVLEVIYRRIQQGDVFREAAIGGVKEIAAPITSSTLATVVIFLPLAFVGGIAGELFVPFALTVTFALVASLLVALVVIPALSDFPVSKKESIRKTDAWYQRFYTLVLKWALSHRAVTLVIATVLFLGSLSLLPIIGTSFMPSMGEKMLTVEIEMPAGADLETAKEMAILAEKALEDNPEVGTYLTSAGTSSSFMGGLASMMGGGLNSISIKVFLDTAADMEQEAARLREAYKTITREDIVITVSTGERMASQMMGGGLDISIRGDDYTDITYYSQQLFDALEDIDGIADLELDFADVEPKLDIVPDTAKIMSSGLSPQQMQQLSQEFYLMMMGGTVNQVDIEGRTYEVFLNGITQKLSSAEMAGQLKIGWPNPVSLADIARVELGEQPTNLPRVDRKLSAGITGNIVEKDVGAVNRVVQEKIDGLSLAPGVEISTGGTMEMMQETFSDMYIAIIIAIVLAYVVIAVTFRSFLNPLIIMVSLPLASIGALLGLLIAGQTLGISAMMGILMLVGIVLTNAIVLISLVEQLRKNGMETGDALVEGGRTRIRPILMTALTTMVAMLPLAFGLGEGTLMAAELAVVVVGGLFSSTLLTLLVIPVIYSLVKGRRKVSSG
jgi:HAE1 family hydrophobic/amphiphilic exporter-1